MRPLRRIRGVREGINLSSVVYGMYVFVYVCLAGFDSNELACLDVFCTLSVHSIQGKMDYSTTNPPPRIIAGSSML